MTELFRCRDGHVSSVHRPGKMTCFFCPRPVERLPDFDRLRDERDRAVETRENANAVSVRVEMENRELRRVAGVLADALRATLDPEPCWYDHNGRCQAHGVTKPCDVAEARSALAVFDTLTEEKTDE